MGRAAQSDGLLPQRGADAADRGKLPERSAGNPTACELSKGSSEQLPGACGRRTDHPAAGISGSGTGNVDINLMLSF